MQNNQTIRSRIAGAAGDLHYEAMGTGESVLVFIHSMAGNTRHWTRQMEHFQGRHRVLALDLRGHGESGFERGPRESIKDLAEDVVHVLDELKIGKAILIGHSMGGLVALECAARQAERTRGLILVDSAGDARAFPREMVEGICRAILSEENRDTLVAHWEQMLAPSDPDVREFVLEGLKNVPRTLLADITRDCFEYDPVPALEKYTGPVHAITTPFGDVPGALHRLREDIPMTRMENTGHWLQLDAPEEFNRLLDESIREIGAT